ncbi:bifunctional diguanylate cyclase/phosphodiesterase [Leptospira congkakensis]|uniref:Bifunctional diguanylate cyclase/phosphodiesterase n=1 Tax=Leptospira congkakensis TaxID=2484932 RepID=A0A4Z1A9T4_9LEPT|nr:bifunctional diguanylate cyclase/phosphodiesterase [Leptospira congkakensis]TGL86642.1 bifunctional diguanylate cyclase/phosphodiesterase [Leptospira congkakensis]TGL93813.1 bifunctional diguanylate cyclase/phosphodiesterase [Leptospira congkakensis]TGL94781.1 bifunctional diguanylate cyclase/phosphodiesterase [Leptospira congkakensis]
MSLKQITIYIEEANHQFYNQLLRDITNIESCNVHSFHSILDIKPGTIKESAVFLFWNDPKVLEKQKFIFEQFPESPYILLSVTPLTPTELEQAAHPTFLHLAEPTYSVGILDLILNFAERLIEDMNRSIAYDKIREKVIVLQNVFEESLDILMQIDPGTNQIINANKQAVVVLEYPLEEIVGKEFSFFMPPVEVDEDEEFEGNLIESTALKTKLGKLIPTESSFRLFPVNGKMAIWATFRDITERKRSQEQVKNQKAFYEFILDNLDSDIAVLNSNYQYEYTNPVFLSNKETRKWLFKKTDAELAEKLELPAEFHEKRKKYLDVAAKENEIVQFEELVQDSNDKVTYLLRKYIPIDDAETNKKSFISFGVDITERKLSEERISYLAYYDALTGLSNRTLFIDHANQALKNHKSTETLLAFYFFDIDNFKFINDSLGHTKGDILLQMVAARLKRVMTEVDTVARFGGDEFAILKVDVLNKSAAAEFAQKILDILSQPFHIMGRDLFTTISMGIALSPNDGVSTSELLKNSDMAMYKAKELGRNNFKFYTNELILRSEKRLYIENSLRKAIQNEELILFFQPKISTVTNQVCGAEALIRWKHPERGWVPPVEFIPVAEDSGIIERIGDWVLEEACRLKKEWNCQDLPSFPVSINVSGKQLARTNWSQRVQATILQFGIRPEEIELELTESSIMENPEKSIEAFEYLAGLGIKVSIDDFGTGYSSLSYLKKINADVLKIDRSFVIDLEINEDDRAICKAIINMAHSLGMEVIAEGVENPVQRDLLHDLGCHMIQGYLYSKPLPAEDFVTFVKNFNESAKTK